jgi:hypothetical protein
VGESDHGAPGLAEGHATVIRDSARAESGRARAPNKTDVYESVLIVYRHKKDNPTQVSLGRRMPLKLSEPHHLRSARIVPSCGEVVDDQLRGC